MWEVTQEVESWKSRGYAKRNKCKEDSSSCEFGSSAGGDNNSDLNIPAGIKWLETLHITMQERNDGKSFKVSYGHEDRIKKSGEDEMDCSELVSRYLQKVEWSSKVPYLVTWSLYDVAIKHPEWFEKHDSIDYKPKKGDVFLWKSLNGKMGHTGVVVDYNSTTDIVTTIESITGKSVANEKSKAFDGKEYRFNFGGVIKCVWKRNEYHLLSHTTKNKSGEVYRSSCRFYTPKVHFSKEDKTFNY
jgi:hypothetical protein